MPKQTFTRSSKLAEIGIAIGIIIVSCWCSPDKLVAFAPPYNEQITVCFESKRNFLSALKRRVRSSRHDFSTNPTACPSVLDAKPFVNYTVCVRLYYHISPTVFTRSMYEGKFFFRSPKSHWINLTCVRPKDRIYNRYHTYKRFQLSVIAPSLWLHDIERGAHSVSTVVLGNVKCKPLLFRGRYAVEIHHRISDFTRQQFFKW